MRLVKSIIGIFFITIFLQYSQRQALAIAVPPPDSFLKNEELLVREDAKEFGNIPVKAMQYYRLQLQSKIADKGMWDVEFYNAVGEKITNQTDYIPSSEVWKSSEFFIRMPYGTEKVKVRLVPVKGDVLVKNVSLTSVSKKETAEWADKIAESLPDLKFEGLGKPGKELEKIGEGFHRAGTFRIVMLGDSIIQDTSNSAFETLLERQFPNIHIEVVDSIRSATGCWFYQDPEQLKKYVLDRKPDLLVIGGISHRYDIEAIRKVIHGVKAISNPEILITTGAVAARESMDWKFHFRMFCYRLVLARIARQEKAAFLDTRSIWDHYIAASQKDPDWFYRDIIHANIYGKQVLGRMLKQYLAGAAAS